MVCRFGLLLSVLLLSACGGGSSTPKASQTLIKVDSEEITVHQLNEELALLGEANLSQQKMLEMLVDRQLLVNQAKKDKLDRDPAVMQAMERAKAIVLAQAYVEKKASAAFKLDSAEIERLYQQQSAQFEGKTLEQAAPMIANQLVQQRMDEVRKRELARLHLLAEIEVVGDKAQVNKD